MKPMGTKGPPLRLLAVGVLTMVLLTTSALAADQTPASAIPMSETTSLMTAIAKVTGALIVVIGLMLLLLHVIKRSGLGSGGGRSGSAITVLETRMVAPKKYITIVDIAGQCLALGVTDHTITRLADLGPDAKTWLAAPAGTAKPAATFAGLLNRSMQAWRDSPSRSGENEPGTNRENRPEDAP